MAEPETFPTSISLGFSPNTEMGRVDLGDEITIRITGRVRHAGLSRWESGRVLQSVELEGIKVEVDPPH